MNDLMKKELKKNPVPDIIKDKKYIKEQILKGKPIDQQKLKAGKIAKVSL